MIQALRRKTSIYAAIATMVPKLFLAYSLWVWMEFFVQILAMTIFVYFWRAVYSGTSQIGGLGNFLVGAALVAKASISLHIPWTALNLIYLVLMVLSGGVIFIALNLITATSAFWVVESIPVTQIIFNTHEFTKYPLTIYNRGIGILMTWLIPYGFASFYPANYLLGRDHTWIAWASPAVAAVLMALAYRIWLFGLRHYSGTGRSAN
jgi:ABC-2 type transport system permease protein